MSLVLYCFSLPAAVSMSTTGRSTEVSDPWFAGDSAAAGDLVVLVPSSGQERNWDFVIGMDLLKVEMSKKKKKKILF